MALYSALKKSSSAIKFQVMTTYLKRIDEANKLVMNKPQQSDVIYYSELNEWYTANAFRSFSVKYVLENCIHYKIDGTVRPVTAGQYMVACQNSDVKAYFETRSGVKSICVDICPNTMAEAFTVLTDKNHDLDNYLSGYFRYPEFFETVNIAAATSMGIILQHLHKQVLHNEIEGINQEWFMDLAARIVYQEYGTYLSLNELRTVRASTRKEILRRLHMAKQFIDENFLDICEIRDIARHCSLSEFHFFRSFKQVYKKTPLQYIVEKKMQLAKALLLQPGYKVSQVAAICHYPDVFTFSKAFKRFYRCTPSVFRQDHRAG